MHIAYISIESPYDESRGGGIASYLRAMIPAMLAEGHEVTLISQASEPPANLPHNHNLRVKHIRLPSLHWYLSKAGKISNPLVLPVRQLEWSVAFFLAAKRVLQYHPADVVETAETGALFFAWLKPTNLVIRLHGSDFIFRKFAHQPVSSGAKFNFLLEKQALLRARLVTAPSQFQAFQVAGLMGWGPNRIQVIPNPLAAAYFINPMVKTKKRRPIIFFAGRLAPVKGIETLLRAIPLIREACPQAITVLAGELQMPGLQLNHDAKLGLRQGLLWLGHQNQTEIMKWYQRASIFVMPSFYETFGISVLEAMAFDLPVVASRAGALPEVVEDGVTGLLVPPGDEKALADAIIQLLNDPGLCKRMGQAGQKRVIEKYTAARVARQTITLNNKLLAN